jgi:microcystin-dependent protein
VEPFIGTIILFGGNFAPRGWAFCHGQLLPINSHQALFSILGTTYGGDGRTTFGLPDLRGRAPIGTGSGPGLTNRRLGSRGGSENTTLDVNQMPTHSHALNASTTVAGQVVPGGNRLGRAQADVYTQGESNVALAADSVGNNGASQPHDNMMPYLGINYIIALVGTFPARN